MPTDSLPTLEFLIAGDRVGPHLQRLEWTATPLGPPDAWPQSLKSAISICLGSSFQIGIYWGPDLVLLYNDAWSPILGSKHPWALGRPAREVWPEIWDTIGPLFQQVMSTGIATRSTDQLLAMHRHGFTEECYFDYTFSPIRNEAGQVGGIFNAVVETTFRVIGERRTRLQSDLNEALARAGTADDVFRASTAILGRATLDVGFALLYYTDEADGRLTCRIETDRIPADLAPTTLDALDHSPWPIADVLQSAKPLSHKLATPLPHDVWPEPIAQALLVPLAGLDNSQPDGVLIVGISPRLALNDDYCSFLDRLGSTIGAALTRARVAESARKRAEELAALDRAKTTFFSNVSHEFRTPLTLMLGPLESLQSREDASHEDREQLRLAYRNAQRLLKLVNSLLDFSRIEAGRMQPTYVPVDLAELTRDFASSFQSAIEGAGLTFRVATDSLPATVFVDIEMWEKVVLNLLSNAFKFTLDGAIDVSVRDGGDHARVEVRDTGVGIPAEELPRLFERFHRVTGSQGRTNEGTGIGLALVQELVKLHGATIRGASTLGHGTTFTIDLPYGSQHLPSERVRDRPARATATIAAPSFVAEARRWLPQDSANIETIANFTLVAGSEETAHILLADDNADMRSYLKDLLQPFYSVHSVGDGIAALEAIRRQRPDLVITDVMMPRLDGFGLLRELRADRALQNLPVILLSARAGEEARIDGVSAGADDYLVKPFSARELLARVRGALQLDRLRQQSTAALSESEARFRNMADHAPVMMWVTDANGACTYLNRAWFDFTGQTQAEAEGFGWLDATHPEDRDRAGDTFVAANARHESFRLEYRLRRHDGVFRWAIDAAAPRFDPQGTFVGYIGSVIDITDRKEAEELLRRTNDELETRVQTEVGARVKAEDSLRQAQKMESLGQLTGGIAHDFNNMLVAVIGNLDLMRRRLARGDSNLGSLIANAAEGANRAAALTHRLLMFARQQPLSPVAVDINKLVTGMSQLLQRTLGEHILTETVLAGGLWTSHVDPNLLESAIVNLAVNARDAMTDGGKLTIETANAYLDDEYSASHAGVEPGQYVMIAISDTGVGMSADVIARAFEPFYTTKGVGKGTGLGLSQVYGFARQSRGQVKIYSEVDRGTTVKLYMPRHYGPAIATDRPDTRPAPRAEAGVTVLLVEDEEQVRKLGAMALEELGYAVVVAENAREALQLLERFPHIQLLFTDVVMPEMDGSKLAAEAVKRNPHLKVLYTTGYTRNAIVHNGVLDAGVNLLNKPFSLEQLARKIAEVLAR